MSTFPVVTELMHLLHLRMRFCYMLLAQLLTYKSVQQNRIRLQTNVPPRTLEGTLYTICPQTSVIAISTSSTTHHIIPISSLTSFTILALVAPSSSQGPNTTTTTLAPLKTSALLARANAALERAKEKASRTNKDVSKEAQEIFDALYRQFPGTRWAGKDMVVLDSVLIKGPGYRSEDCKAAKGGEGALGRVKKVVSFV